MSIFKGSGVALITPFNDDFSVDYESLFNIIDFQIRNGTDSIIVCGTTGEASTLDDDEHLEVIKRCVKRVNGRIPVIAGTGSNNTSHAIEMSKKAEKLGVDGLLIVTPYYNKTTQKGLKVHYKAIADSVKLSILMYNVPSRTGCNIEPETVIEIVKDNENIIGIKEASGNEKQVKKISDLFINQGIKLDLYSGNDNDVISLLENSGIGVISVCANIAPKRTHEMVYHYVDKDLDYAKKIQDKQTELSEVLFSEVNPIPIKEACYQMGLINTNNVRLPLVNMEEENKKNLIKVMKNQGFIRKDKIIN